MSPFWLSAFLDFAPEDYPAGTAFWQEVTGYGLSGARGDGEEFASLLPATGDDFLRVQRLQQGPSRVHLDLHVTDPHDATEAAVALGARLVARAHPTYDVLVSPGGLTFCHVTHRATERPAPATWPGGHTSLVDQVCLDMPASVHDAEVEFWAALTGWELRRSPVVAEFSNLARPDGIPLRLLLQRLGEDDGPVRAHLDLATSDRPAETARHLGLGARVLDTREHFTVLAGPVGPAYCLTDRDPLTGMMSR